MSEGFIAKKFDFAQDKASLNKAVQHVTSYARGAQELRFESVMLGKGSRLK